MHGYSFDLISGMKSDTNLEKSSEMLEMSAKKLAKMQLFRPLLPSKINKMLFLPSTGILLKNLLVEVSISSMMLRIYLHQHKISRWKTSACLMVRWSLLLVLMSQLCMEENTVLLDATEWVCIFYAQFHRILFLYR